MLLTVFLGSVTLFTGVSWLKVMDLTGHYTLAFMDIVRIRFERVRQTIEDQKQRQQRVELVKVQNAVTRLATGARLEGPAVSFFRAGSPGGRTLATGRPHMTIPDRGGGEPVEVDADEAEFIGDSVSIGRGFVEIGRSDFDATADSAMR